MFYTSEEIDRILNEVVDYFLLPRFRELGMPASGEWERNLEVIAEDNGGIIRGRDYSQQLALGRRPGKMPPVSEIEKWVRVKLGRTGRDATSMAWAIAKKIEKSGTSWYQKGGSDLIEVLESQAVLDYIQHELEVIAQARIVDNLVRNAQKIFT